MYNTSRGAFPLARRVRAMRARYDQRAAVTKRWYRPSPGRGRPPRWLQTGQSVVVRPFQTVVRSLREPKGTRGASALQTDALPNRCATVSKQANRTKGGRVAVIR